ncbi:response regulator [Parapedobacter pyrenivorans]|nr:response regulator [Parapedobacter pyrenivorans]
MKETLLIIDDQVDILNFLNEILADRYQVLTALNAKAALEVLQTRVVHLVISDVMMPGMDGFALCDLLKTTVDYCHIPVILLTAKNSFRSKIEGLQLGADAYIAKPFSPELLLVQVDNLLKNRDKIREHAKNKPFEHLQLTVRSKSDEQFLGKLNDYIHEHIRDANLSMDLLADYMGMSRPTFYRKVKAVTNLSPKELVDQVRIKKAAELIAENDLKIFQVANKVGYNSQAVFGQNFQKYFKRSPREYMALLKTKLGS